MAAVPEQGAGEFEQGEVSASVLAVADEDRATLAQPSQGAFHHPAPSAEPESASCGARPAAPNVRDVPVLGRRLASCGIVVALVQTPMLRPLATRHRPLDHDGLDGRHQELRVVHVRLGYHHRQGATLALHQQALLGAVLAPIRTN